MVFMFGAVFGYAAVPTILPSIRSQTFATSAVAFYQNGLQARELARQCRAAYDGHADRRALPVSPPFSSLRDPFLGSASHAHHK